MVGSGHPNWLQGFEEAPLADQARAVTTSLLSQERELVLEEGRVLPKEPTEAVEDGRAGVEKLQFPKQSARVGVAVMRGEGVQGLQEGGEVARDGPPGGGAETPDDLAGEFLARDETIPNDGQTAGRLPTDLLGAGDRQARARGQQREQAKFGIDLRRCLGVLGEAEDVTIADKESPVVRPFAEPADGRGRELRGDPAIAATEERNDAAPLLCPRGGIVRI